MTSARHAPQDFIADTMPRGLTRAIGAMASTIEAVFQVFAEAEEGASAARCRFPLAD